VSEVTTAKSADGNLGGLPEIIIENAENALDDIIVHELEDAI